MLAGMKLARRLLHTPELAPYFDGDMLPGPEVQSDDEWLDFARRYGSTSYHLIGTARMGPASDRTAVVDDRCACTGCRGCAWWTLPSCRTCRPPIRIARR